MDISQSEGKIVSALNGFFEERGVDAIAYRIKQHRFTSQVIDILVDSRHWKFYLAMEVKSISVEKGARALYFSQHFSKHGSAHQVERISEFLKRSGRWGLLAVELRHGAGHPLECRLIRWTDVDARFRKGESGFRVEEIQKYPGLPSKGGSYRVDAQILEEAM